MAEVNKTFRIGVVGDSGVGKTSFIRRIATRHWYSDYIPTVDMTTTSVNWNTNHGLINLVVCEIPAANDSEDLFKDFDGIVMLFSFTSLQSVKFGQNLEKRIKTINPYIRIVKCYNKFDTKKKEFKMSEVPTGYCHRVSLKWSYNIYDPFISLLRHLTKDIDFDLQY
jgi:GTPase SAR1 family protein